MSHKQTHTIGRGKYIELVHDSGWEYAHRVTGKGVVAIVAVTANNELVLTEQFRYPVQKKVIDLPAGLSGDIAGEEGEAEIRAAERELLEETGFKSKSMTYVATCPTSPGLSSEMISIFLATGAEKVADGGGDESESIKVHVVPLAKIHAWLERKATKKTCIDVKVYSALGILGRTSG